MPSTKHFQMLYYAEQLFHAEGMRTFVTENKIPDMIISDAKGMYAVEVLVDPSVELVQLKINKYLKEDLDGIYFIIPKTNPELSRRFSQEKVAFILGVDNTGIDERKLLNFLEESIQTKAIL